MTHPVIEVAKEKLNGNDADIYTLSSGIRVRFHPVNQMDIQAVSQRVKEPEVPIFLDSDKGREMPNPNDPDYLKALSEANFKRGMLATEALLLGVELVGGMPTDDHWLKVLRFKHKRGIIDISEFDLDDELEREFVYKKHVAFLNADDYTLLQKALGSLGREVEQNRSTFRNNQKRDEHLGSRTETPEGISE